MSFLRIRILLALFSLGSPALAVEMLHQNPKACDLLLQAKTIGLAELLGAGIVEPDGGNLFSPRENITDHEYRTAELLASRLGRQIALIPNLSGVNVPSVDGTMFDARGEATHNFSLKTFSKSASDGTFLNDKLLETMRKAESQIARNYWHKAVGKIVRSFLPPDLTQYQIELESRLHRKIFGFQTEPVLRRPIVIVIDYTLDASAIFRIHSTVDDNFVTKTFLTLNKKNTGLNILELMRDLRNDPVVKEYVFLGPHHMVHVTTQGYQMTEFCDALGHDHGHDHDDEIPAHVHGQ